jgi:hypothetical protein
MSIVAAGIFLLPVKYWIFIGGLDLSGLVSSPARHLFRR